MDGGGQGGQPWTVMSKIVGRQRTRVRDTRRCGFSPILFGTGFAHRRIIRHLTHCDLRHRAVSGCGRDRAGNRQLHYDQYCLLLLLYMFNPIVTSLRGLQQASELKKVQKKLGCASPRLALGSHYGLRPRATAGDHRRTGRRGHGVPARSSAAQRAWHAQPLARCWPPCRS